MDNIVIDLPHKNKFGICLKNIIIIQLPQHLFAEADTKKQICLSKSLGICRLLRQISNAGKYSFYFDLYNISGDIRESLPVCKRFSVFKNHCFQKKKGFVSEHVYIVEILLSLGLFKIFIRYTDIF